MTKTELMTAMQAHRLVAVIRSRTAEDALATARAVGEGGVRFVEVTFTVPGAAEVIRTLAGEGEVHVGAGTVLSEEQARTGIEAGARFIVSPSLELDLVPLCREAGVASIPAGATPTEVVQALRAGADLVKDIPRGLRRRTAFHSADAGPVPRCPLYGLGGRQQRQRRRVRHPGGHRYRTGQRLPGRRPGAGGPRRARGQAREFVTLVDDALGGAAA